MNKRVKRRLSFFGVILLLILFISVWSNSKQVNNSKNAEPTKETFIVVIDPGHGGIDPGTIGASGLYEKDFTLSLSKKVNEILEKEEKIQVYMTKQDVDYTYRPNFANELGADLYISIHGNSFEDSKVSGTETYYYHKKYKSFAEIMHKHVVGSTGFNDRGVRKEDLVVVRDTDMPSVLLEIGYLTNPQQEQKMLNDEFQYSVAESICDGVKEYLKIKAG